MEHTIREILSNALCTLTFAFLSVRLYLTASQVGKHHCHRVLSGRLPH